MYTQACEHLPNQVMIASSKIALSHWLSIPKVGPGSRNEVSIPNGRCGTKPRQPAAVTRVRGNIAVVGGPEAQAPGREPVLPKNRGGFRRRSICGRTGQSGVLRRARGRDFRFECRVRQLESVRGRGVIGFQVPAADWAA